MVGADQMPAPDGPYVSAPVALMPVFVGTSTRYVFQATDPSRTCNAVTLPRNVQQGYRGSIERVSSQDAAGTNARPSCTVMDPVSRVASCSSTLVFQRGSPVRASR